MIRSSLLFTRRMSTVREIISTKNAPAAIGPYSQAVRIGDTLYVSGSIGVDPATGNFVGEGTEAQTHQALKNIGEILKTAGVGYNNVVKTTVLLANMDDFVAVNGVYSEYFKEPYPARAAYQVARLPKNAKIEIEAIAHIGEISDK